MNGAGTLWDTAGRSFLTLTLTRPSRGVLVVGVAGEVDLVTAATFHQELFEAASTNPAHLLINLEHVTFFSATGITTLLQLREQCGEADIGLSLVTPVQVRRLLHLVGFGEIFTMFDSRERAIAALAFG